MPAGRTYEAIATQTLASTSTSIVFSSIPGTYTDLVVIINCGESTTAGLLIKLNNDSNALYSQTRLTGNGTTPTSNRRSSTATVYVDDGILFGTAAGDNNAILQFMNYSNTTTNKTWLQRYNSAANGTGASVGLYRPTSTAAITSIEFSMSSGNIVTGSTFSLYGIRAA